MLKSSEKYIQNTAYNKFEKCMAYMDYLIIYYDGITRKELYERTNKVFKKINKIGIYSNPPKGSFKEKKLNKLIDLYETHEFMIELMFKLDSTGFTLENWKHVVENRKNIYNIHFREKFENEKRKDFLKTKEQFKIL